MVWWLLVAHLVGVAGSAMAGVRWSLRHGLAVAALPLVATTLWAVGQLVSGPSLAVVERPWVAGLDLTLRFRIDALASLATVLVAGIGTLVSVYAAGYFGPGVRNGRFPATLLAFALSMLGLVWADSVWTLFVFWELTSVTSFLLVGHDPTDAGARAAARRALLVTGAGGLVLLAGLLVLADAAGTTSISSMGPVTGTRAVVAAVLVLIGAATKSAQVPFHVWLPGAMAAPTPVSAYLHSATMVKAGVLLVAVLRPAFAAVGTWTWLGLALGVSTVLWGGVGALRHRDAKLILAWGTVSQLGLLITLLGAGSGKAVLAATAILVAHALFKAALFMVIGEIDIRTGTRVIDELGGLARSMPVAFAIALLAGLSMAGVPPLLGFAAKEAAVEAVLGLQGAERVVAGIGVIGGSVLTVAYTARLLLCVFGSGPPTAVAPRRLALTVPAAVPAVAGLVGFVVLGPVNGVVGPAAVEIDPGAGAYSLSAWPGPTAGLGVSVAVVILGSILGWVVAGERGPGVPRPLGAVGVAPPVPAHDRGDAHARHGGGRRRCRPEPDLPAPAARRPAPRHRRPRRSARPTGLRRAAGAAGEGHHMILDLALLGFFLAGLCGTHRIIAGPELVDRIAALDVTLIALMGAITIDAARRDDGTYLIALVVVAIVGFTATVAASRFVEQAPDRDQERAP